MGLAWLDSVVCGHVFHDPRTGKPWHSEEPFQRVYWAPILKRLGIRYRRPYTMLHSYATSMPLARMTPAFCARQLGHTVKMLLCGPTRNGSTAARTTWRWHGWKTRSRTL